MRDDQVQRYARHILVPDIGGLGQTALLVAAARLDLRDAEAARIAATFLAAGGVGKLALEGATDAQIEDLAAHGPDTVVVPDDPTATEVSLPEMPAWWPSAPNDALALAYWRGAIAATRWMADVANG